MSARSRYAALLEQLYLARADRPLSMAEEYEFTCELEKLWDELTESEQHDIEALTEEYKRHVVAPDELGVDLVVTQGEHTRPRRAA
jgi:hypothetical protein